MHPAEDAAVHILSNFLNAPPPRARVSLSNFGVCEEATRSLITFAYDFFFLTFGMSILDVYSSCVQELLKYCDISMIGKLDSLCRGTRGIDDRWWKDSHAAMARGCTTWKATGRRAFDLSHLDTSKGRTYNVATERIILMTEWEGVVYACTDSMRRFAFS